jgi:hypothetical protein
VAQQLGHVDAAQQALHLLGGGLAGAGVQLVDHLAGVPEDVRVGHAGRGVDGVQDDVRAVSGHHLVEEVAPDVLVIQPGKGVLDQGASRLRVVQDLVEAQVTEGGTDEDVAPFRDELDRGQGVAAEAGLAAMLFLHLGDGGLGLGLGDRGHHDSGRFLIQEFAARGAPDHSPAPQDQDCASLDVHGWAIPR